MLRQTPSSSFKTLETLSVYLHKLGLIGTLCIINIFFLAILAGLMIALSEHRSLFLLSLLTTGIAGSLLTFFLVRLDRLTSANKKHQIQSIAYEKLSTPLLILTPERRLICGNQKAQEACWWAANLTLLKNALSSKESRDALERLVEPYEKAERIETLVIRQENGVEEIWQIQSFPFGKNALWQCSNVTSKRDTLNANSEKIKILTSLMDSTAEGLFSLNEKGVLLFCNDKFSQWLGYEREQMIGKSLAKFLAKPRSQESAQLPALQGKHDFMTSSSRTKSFFLEQTQVPLNKGFITYSVAHLHMPFSNQNDLSRVLNMSPQPVVCLDEKGKIQDSNFLFREQFWPHGIAIQGASFLDLVADFQKEDITHALQSFLNGNEEGSPLEIHLKDVKESIVAAYLATLPLKNRKGLFIQFSDITEQKKFESQLVQSQKMQAVGQLAGGIAHDFNNLLTAMIGFCDLLLLRHTPGDQSFTDVMQIKQNANRAANLVRQLLAFSRQQTLQPKILDITECLAELSALLRRLIGSNIELKIKHERELGLVLVDQGQFEQVIINMAVNARDAMEGGGTITVTTQNFELKKAKRYGHDVIPPGSYVLVEISDTGGGIKSEIIDRIFDPFFSTKEVGSGTGLGLSTVYGIVKQTGGFIQVDSKVGEGTTFSIYLPRYAAEGAKPEPRTREKTPPQDLTGSSTILLVEDEDAVRLFSGRALRSKGYKVIEAINGREALDFMKADKEKIDLVISDVVMPQMDGPSFINAMSQMGLHPKVLFISGYTEDTFHSQLKNKTNVRFLSKPFSLSDLAIRVKEIIDESSETT